MKLWKMLPLKTRLEISMNHLIGMFDDLEAKEPRLAQLVMNYVEHERPTSREALNGIMVMCGIANRF